MTIVRANSGEEEVCVEKYSHLQRTVVLLAHCLSVCVCPFSFALACFLTPSRSLNHFDTLHLTAFQTINLHLKTTKLFVARQQRRRRPMLLDRLPAISCCSALFHFCAQAFAGFFLCWFISFILNSFPIAWLAGVANNQPFLVCFLTLVKITLFSFLLIAVVVAVENYCQFPLAI